jgi:porin
MVPGRPRDRFGASVIYARFADSVRSADRDTIAFTGTPIPVRKHETNLELTYVAEIVRGWYVQPVLTFVWHPNGDPSRNATVTGVRSVWRF